MWPRFWLYWCGLFIVCGVNGNPNDFFTVKVKRAALDKANATPRPTLPAGATLIPVHGPRYYIVKTKRKAVHADRFAPPHRLPHRPTHTLRWLPKGHRTISHSNVAAPTATAPITAARPSHTHRLSSRRRGHTPTAFIFNHHVTTVVSDPSPQATPTVAVHSHVPATPPPPPMLPAVSPPTTMTANGNNTSTDGRHLQLAILFYEAQRSGQLPGDQRVRWRRSAHINDGTAHGYNLTGGYYDAGDFVKFGLPGAYTATLLAWTAVDYATGLWRADQWTAHLSALRWATDYLLRSHVRPDTFVVQVGDPGPDHSYWGSPEDMPGTLPRPVYVLSPQYPGTEPLAETAAALAASAIVFTRSDPAYARRLVHHAQQLYLLAEQHPARYQESVARQAGRHGMFGVTDCYESSGYYDELAWGAAWLYRATGHPSFLRRAERYFALSLLKGGGVRGTFLSWDDKSPAVLMLLARFTSRNYYRTMARRYTAWAVDESTRTPGGLLWIHGGSEWGSATVAAATAFLAAYHDDYIRNLPVPSAMTAAHHSTPVVHAVAKATKNSADNGPGEDVPAAPTSADSDNGDDDLDDTGPERIDKEEEEGEVDKPAAGMTNDAPDEQQTIGINSAANRFGLHWENEARDLLRSALQTDPTGPSLSNPRKTQYRTHQLPQPSPYHSKLQQQPLAAPSMLSTTSHLATSPRSATTAPSPQPQQQLALASKWDRDPLPAAVRHGIKYHRSGNALPPPVTSGTATRRPGRLALIRTAAVVAAPSPLSRPQQTAHQFARQQLDYLLGKNPANISYVVGASTNSPQRVHHAAAHGVQPGTGWRHYTSNEPNRYMLYGALVGGPDQMDRFMDRREDYRRNEPALDYNAPLVLLLARMCAQPSSTSISN